MDRKILQTIVVPLLIICIFLSCKKDKPNTPVNELPKDNTSKVLIVCEGSLGNGNAELSLYNYKSDSVFNDIYKTANKQSLGDVFHGIYKKNDRYFLCVNNSDKIVVLDNKTWLQRASITISKPRNILAITDHKAYVGSLFSNKIYVLNTTTLAVEKEIAMPYQNVEGMLLKDGIAFICCWDTACNKLYKINTGTDQISDSITLGGRAPQSIVLDKENKLWVLGGNAYKNKASNLNRIDIGTKKVLFEQSFEKGVEAIKMCTNANRDSLYFLEVNYAGGSTNNGVFRMNINAVNLPSTPFVSCLANQYFWALGIEPKSGNIYVGDPKGFVQKSSVYIYSPQGKLNKQFNVGLGVGAFYFD
ncbi:MAG: DUF5074 domain-containing protein [Chitinophagaceae bacterium]|jgi:YVTN family beta-propeller protein